MIPADHKWFMRTAVAAIIVNHLADMDPRYPQPSKEELNEMQAEVTQLVRVENGATGGAAPHTIADS